MTFRLIDDCRIEFQGDWPTIEKGLIRRNGDRVTINVWETFDAVLTLTDGTEVSETQYTGKTVQVDALDGVEEKLGKRGEITFTGFSQQAKENGKPEEEQVTTIKVTPGPNCTSCG